MNDFYLVITSMNLQTWENCLFSILYLFHNYEVLFRNEEFLFVGQQSLGKGFSISMDKKFVFWTPHIIPHSTPCHSFISKLTWMTKTYVYNNIQKITRLPSPKSISWIYGDEICHTSLALNYISIFCDWKRYCSLHNFF